MDAFTIGTAFATSCAYVFLKALQQLNVQAKNYVWIPVVSLAMAAGEVLLVTTQVRHGWGWIVLPIGLGGATGALVAIQFHERFVRKT